MTSNENEIAGIYQNDPLRVALCGRFARTLCFLSSMPLAVAKTSFKNTTFVILAHNRSPDLYSTTSQTSHPLPRGISFSKET
jgi:hypothetical protein